MRYRFAANFQLALLRQHQIKNPLVKLSLLNQDQPLATINRVETE